MSKKKYYFYKMGCEKLTYNHLKVLRTHGTLSSHEAKVVQMWLSVDPLAEKYQGISPYVYCAQNPIKYIDPDGERILIWTQRSDGSYRQTAYSYEKNRDYSKIKYSYERNVMIALDKMYEKGVNKKIIDDVIKSKKDLNIIKHPVATKTNVFSRDQGLYRDKKFHEMRHDDSKNNVGIIYWNDEYAVRVGIYKDQKGKWVYGSFSPMGSLLHEKNHAENYFYNPETHIKDTEINQKTGKPIETPPAGFPNKEEQRNTMETNEETKTLGLPDSQRTIYGTGSSASHIKVDDISKTQ